MPMHPTRRASSSLRVSIQSIRAHDVIDAPAEHGLDEQQRCAGGRLASSGLRAFLDGERIAPAAEAQRFDGHRGHAVLDRLDGEIVFVAWLVRVRSEISGSRPCAQRAGLLPSPFCIVGT